MQPFRFRSLPLVLGCLLVLLLLAAAPFGAAAAPGLPLQAQPSVVGAVVREPSATRFPGLVRDLAATQSLTRSDVTVTWRPPAAVSGVSGVVSSYVLTANFDGRHRQVEVLPDRACARRGLEMHCSAVWPNVDPGDRAFGVKARNGHGAGPSRAFTITVAVLDPPSAVRDVTALQVGHAPAATLTWRPPLAADGCSVAVAAYYLAGRGSVPENLGAASCEGTGVGASCTVTRGALAFGEHTWTVWARNVAGVGPRVSVTFDVWPAFTAQVRGVPVSHDGDRFTVRLTFSEDVRIGYRALRDHAFRVTGGRIDRARRVRRGSSTRWSIRVRPNRGETFSATLLAGRPCAEQGALCAGNGRMLDEPVTFRVRPE